MRHLRLLSSIAITAGLLLFCYDLARAGEPTKAPPSSSEQEWIIFTTLNELSRLAAYSAVHDRMPAAVQVSTIKGNTPPAYQVVIPLTDGSNLTETLSITENPWSPKLYEPLAKKLADHYKLAAAGNYQSDALVALTAFTSDSLMKENRQLSEYLTEHPTDPVANQIAALILGTQAMMEDSGWLWDPSLACCRATMHLAFARALRTDKTITDEDALTELLMGLIIDTKADCTQRIGDLTSRAGQHPELAPWARAAALRNTRDWRLPPSGADGTQIEKMEKFRAFSDGARLALGVKYLRDANPKMDPAINRVALGGVFGVEMGHLFTKNYIGIEMQDVAPLIERPMPHNQVELESFIGALNQAPASVITPDKDGKNTVQVIDRGMWCAFAQRHILNGISTTWNWLQNKWGVPEKAESFWVSTEKIFAELTLYPAVSLDKTGAMHESFPYQERMQKLFQDSPQIVPDMTWVDAISSRLFPQMGARTSAWFTPPVPTGTAYRALARIGALPNFKHPDLAAMEALYRIAPLQEDVAFEYYKAKYPSEDNPEALLDIIGPLADYGVLSLHRLAANAKRNGDNVIEEKALTKLTSFDPDSFAQLGAYYLQRGNTEKARDAYQAMVDQANDRVGMANEAGWLVDYYYDHGQKDKAKAVAQEAAEVYSYTGLEIYAKLLEKTGELAQAEDYYKKIQERYEDNGPLLGFYTRQAEHDQAYAAKLKELTSSALPADVVKVALGDFKEKPAKGVQITSEGPGLAPNGLKNGDIVVALDGLKVGTFKEYSAVRGLKNTPEMQLIIYRDGKFLEISAKSPDRRFGCDMNDWVAD